MGITLSASLGWAPLPFPSASPSLPLPLTRSILSREFSQGSPPDLSHTLRITGGCLSPACSLGSLTIKVPLGRSKKYLGKFVNRL